MLSFIHKPLSIIGVFSLYEKDPKADLVKSRIDHPAAPKMFILSLTHLACYEDVWDCSYSAKVAFITEGIDL
jgi:hypothetical protein